MSPDDYRFSDDDVPSFMAIVEEALGGGKEPGPEVRRGYEMLPEEVISRHLPHYERWEFLGAGGMGVVYKAWHRELMRWAAIKFLSPRQASDARALARFQNEAAVLARLHHPNIVPVHDFGSEGDVAWLVMDYIDGVPLPMWAKQTSPKPIGIAQMVAKIARAVGVAHASGIIHRDLKPGNILVVGDEPVLLDFGLAQDIAWQHNIRLTDVGELAGTVAYLAPEQVDPTLGEPAPATDVHACGVILFELLAGRLPRAGLASQIITRLHEDDQPPRLGSVVKTVRKELDAICWRSMLRIPEDRYANGISLAEDLERFLDGRPVRARHPDLLEMAYMMVRRYPWLIAAGCVALVACVIAVWSIGMMQWSKQRASLLARIHQQLAEPEWTPERIAQTEELLTQMWTVDTVFCRYLREAFAKRTHAEVVRLLDEPRLSEKECGNVRDFIHLLQDKGYPGVEALAERWSLRESAWETVISFDGVSTHEVLQQMVRGEGWEKRADGIFAVPKEKGQTWSTLFGTTKLEGAVEIEVEFGKNWQAAKACGVNFVIPLLKDARFYIYSAERFSRLLPDFENTEKAPVMSILVDDLPVAYAVVPKEVRYSSHLTMRCRYENGELQMALNGGDALYFASIFELARPLMDTSFSILLPVETRLEKLELRQRHVAAHASPFAKADDLVSTGHADQALAIYEKYLNRTDVQTECQYKYAACLEALKRTTDALVAWQQVAEGGEEPWRSLSIYQLWRCYLSQGDLKNANAWFDLLMATKIPQIVSMGIPTADRLILNQHYLPVTRSINCFRMQHSQMEDLERAVRVQKFLGADDREMAVRVAMAFHFAGRDQQARQYYSRAVTGVRPSSSLPDPEIHMTLLCLDHWESLGGADGDAVLQASITAWFHTLKGSRVPSRAIPLLGDLRHRLREGAPLKKYQRETLQNLIADSNILVRHRAEACLVQAEGEKTAHAQTALWKRAVRILDSQESAPDYTQQKLYTEFVARSLVQSWTPQQAIEWMSAMLGQARLLVPKERWAGPLLESLPEESLARALNQVLQGERGRRFAHDFVLRSRMARDLAEDGFQMILMAIFSEGSSLKMEDPMVEESSRLLVKSFSDGQLSEVSLMQFYMLWGGVKNGATWEVLVEGVDPVVKRSLAALLAKRYEKLGKPEEAAAFTQMTETEKPAPKTTQVSQ